MRTSIFIGCALVIFSALSYADQGTARVIFAQTPSALPTMNAPETSVVIERAVVKNLPTTIGHRDIYRDTIYIVRADGKKVPIGIIENEVREGYQGEAICEYHKAKIIRRTTVDKSEVDRVLVFMKIGFSINCVVFSCSISEPEKIPLGKPVTVSSAKVSTEKNINNTVPKQMDIEVSVVTADHDGGQSAFIYYTEKDGKLYVDEYLVESKERNEPKITWKNTRECKPE